MFHCVGWAHRTMCLCRSVQSLANPTSFCLHGWWKTILLRHLECFKEPHTTVTWEPNKYCEFGEEQAKYSPTSCIESAAPSWFNTSYNWTSAWSSAVFILTSICFRRGDKFIWWPIDIGTCWRLKEFKAAEYTFALFPVLFYFWLH